MTREYYTTCWALFAYLLNEYRPQLADYLRRLHELPVDKSAEAWRKAFPKLSPQQLDHDLLRWLRLGEHRPWRLTMAVPPSAATERPLGDADVLAMRSQLRLKLTSDKSAARAEAQAALTLDRTNVLARLVETQIVKTISADDARATAAAHPDDWRAWLLVLLAMRGTTGSDKDSGAAGAGVEVSGDARGALERVCTLAPNALPTCDQVTVAPPTGAPEAASDQ
jgi:hypothetical protein